MRVIPSTRSGCGTGSQRTEVRTGADHHPGAAVLQRPTHSVRWSTESATGIRWVTSLPPTITTATSGEYDAGSVGQLVHQGTALRPDHGSGVQPHGPAGPLGQLAGESRPQGLARLLGTETRGDGVTEHEQVDAVAVLLLPGAVRGQRRLPQRLADQLAGDAGLSLQQAASAHGGTGHEAGDQQARGDRASSHVHRDECSRARRTAGQPSRVPGANGVRNRGGVPRRGRRTRARCRGGSRGRARAR